MTSAQKDYSFDCYYQDSQNKRGNDSPDAGAISTNVNGNAYDPSKKGSTLNQVLNMGRPPRSVRPKRPLKYWVLPMKMYHSPKRLSRSGRYVNHWMGDEGIEKEGPSSSVATMATQSAAII